MAVENREILYKLRVDDAQGAAALDAFTKKMDKMRADAARRSEAGFLGLPSGGGAEKIAKGAVSFELANRVASGFAQFAGGIDKAHEAFTKGEIGAVKFAGEVLKSIPVLGKLAEGIESLGNIANRATRTINENLVEMDRKFLKRLEDREDYAGIERGSQWRMEGEIGAVKERGQKFQDEKQAEIDRIRGKIDRGEVAPERGLEAEAAIIALTKEREAAQLETAKKVAQLEAEQFAEKVAPRLKQIWEDAGSFIGKGVNAAVKLVQEKRAEELAAMVESNRQVDLLNELGKAAAGLFERSDTRQREIFHGTAPNAGDDPFGQGIVAAAQEQAATQTQVAQESLRVQHEMNQKLGTLATTLTKLTTNQAVLIAAKFN